MTESPNRYPWETQASTVWQLFLAQHRADLHHEYTKIEHCLNQLTDEQIWWRPYPEHNAIGNIILHVCGNLRQWIVNGIPQQPDDRQRDLEFSTVDGHTKQQLLTHLRQTLDDVDHVLAKLSEADLLQPRTIQNFNVTVQSAIQHSVPHLLGHTQELIWITRHLTGPNYQFLWTPSPPPPTSQA